MPTLKNLLQAFRRFVIRLLIKPLLRWQPLEATAPGYTIVVACHWRFPEMFEASLLFLAKQDLRDFHSLICAIDAPKSVSLELATQQIQAKFPTLRITFLFQTRIQSLVLRRINWGWVDCWLSYCKGLAQVSTRYVMLHDMDAMLLDPGFIRQRYECITSKQLDFLGVRWYTYNGLEESDRLLYVVEMMLDVQWLRRHFAPIDLFNKLYYIGKRRLDLDTLIYPQIQSTAKMEMPIGVDQWVHPSQVISQFTYLVARPGYIPPVANNLFFIPYFMHLAGYPTAMREQSEHLARAVDGSTVVFFGHVMNMKNMTREHFAWIKKQVEQVEISFAGRVRDDVSSYLTAISDKIAA